MSYIDGFVVAVANENKQAYIKHANETAEIFKEHGALSVTECWGDDVPEGKVTSFPMAVKCQENETVCFSWITWPSKQVRDEGMQKLMQDSRMNCETPMPFDGQRVIFGGFEVIVNT